MPIDLEGENRMIEFDGLKISWEIQRSAKSSFRLPKPASSCGWFDAGKLKSPVLLRHWRPGDRFQPIGMAHAVKLQDLFANLKIPRAQRHQLVVAEAGGENLFWVEGLRISDRFKLDEETTRRLKWRWFRKPAEGDLF